MIETRQHLTFWLANSFVEEYPTKNNQFFQWLLVPRIPHTTICKAIIAQFLSNHGSRKNHLHQLIAILKQHRLTHKKRLLQPMTMTCIKNKQFWLHLFQSHQQQWLYILFGSQIHHSRWSRCFCALDLDKGATPKATLRKRFLFQTAIGLVWSSMGCSPGHQATHSPSDPAEPFFKQCLAFNLVMELQRVGSPLGFWFVNRFVPHTGDPKRGELPLDRV